jgi:phage-related protein
MSKKKYTAYEGEAFTIEWYFNEAGTSPALDYYINLPAKEKIILFKLMGEMGKIRDKTKFNYEHDGIYAFKPKPYRFLSFFMEGKKIIVTHAFKKQQQKLPKTEKERALTIKEDYELRIKRGTYYEP